MRSIYLTLVLLFGLIKGHSQNSTYKIDGRVLASNMPAEGATVHILLAADSSILHTVVTPLNGSFSFQHLTGGNYLLSVSAVGFNKYQSGILTINQSTIYLSKTVSLLAKSASLKTVTVAVKKPFIEQKPGKTLVNVDASATSTGLNALELLEKSPGVSVDKDGNISLQGKTGVLILIDGKQTYLSGADLASLLKNIQSNNLDQIEIMTNPPAKYDAAGNSGIINIKTKKSTIRGMNGSLSNTYTQGFYGRTNNSLGLNYRNNKINIFGNYGFNYYESYNSLVITRNFYKAGNTTIAGTSDQVSRPHSNGTNHNGKAGFDYQVSKKDVIGLVLNANINKGNESPAGNINVRDPLGIIAYSLNTVNANDYSFLNLSTNVNYKHSFDSTGREISVDADYARYNKQSNTLMNTQTYDGFGDKSGPDLALRGDIPSYINIYSIKADYEHPLSKTVNLEAGAKSSLVNTDNKVDYTRFDGTNWKVDDRTSQFIYQEAIHAAYVTGAKSWKKWNLNVGLRLENTWSHGRQVKNDSAFTRQYTNFFPNLGVGFDANEKNQFNFSYSRRIDRPNYSDLNPFVFFLDSLTYGQGNPYLRPQFTNKLEVSHTFKRFVTTTLNYSHTNNVITQLLKQDTEKKITYQTTDNVNSMTQVGLTVIINKPLKKWWNTNIYLNAYNNHYKGLYQTDPIDIQFSTFATNITNSFTFSNGWGAEVSGFYRSKAADGLLVAKSMWAVNSGITKQLLNKKATLKLGVRDVFHTQTFRGYARYSDVDVIVKNTRDSRQASLSFTYRFGKTNIAAPRRKTGGAGDEQNRVNGGGNN